MRLAPNGAIRIRRVSRYSILIWYSTLEHRRYLYTITFYPLVDTVVKIAHPRDVRPNPKIIAVSGKSIKISGIGRIELYFRRRDVMI